MSGTKKLPKYVTYQTLAQFAKAADATFAVRLNAMEERLRAEFGGIAFTAADMEIDQATADALIAELAPYHDVSPMLEQESATYEGNHLAPTTHEGDET